jgi:hypothetical protein
VGGWSRGNEKPTFVDAERDASRSENADGVSGNEIGYPIIDKEAGIINEGGYLTGGRTTTGMVLDSKGERILNGEKSRLKADGVQEGPKGISLLATSGHMSNELPLAEERRGAAISILKPMEQLGGELSQTGADEARSVLKPFSLSRERRTRLSSESKTNWAIRPPTLASFLTPMPSCTGERAEPTRSPTLERATRPTKRYQESPIPFFLGTKTDRQNGHHVAGRDSGRSRLGNRG